MALQTTDRTEVDSYFFLVGIPVEKANSRLKSFEMKDLRGAFPETYRKFLERNHLKSKRLANGSTVFFKVS